jgi:hypothetical protein
MKAGQSGPGMESDRPGSVPSEIKREVNPVQKKPATKLPLRKILAGALILCAVAAAVLFVPKIFSRDKYEKLKDSDGRISVAVMPFKNLTNDTIWNVWEEGIQNELITDLSNYS